MAITPQVEADILAEFKRNRSPFKTARAVGVEVSEVWTVIEKHKDRVDAPEERFGGMGRPELQKFIVFRRPANSREWDNNEPEIADARAKFEAGTHTLCTGRDGQFLILYAIPLRTKAPKPGYFIPEVA